MSLTVSIAMCSFNGARFIEQQLASLAAQTVLPLEVVIFDDRSCDETEAVVAGFALDAPFPVHYATNARRLGYRRNFMQAAAACRGDLVAFCDQDDIWRPDKLEKVIAAFSDPAVVMTHHNAGIVGPEGERLDRLDLDGEHPPIAAPLEENPWRYSLGFTQTFRRGLNAFGDLRESIIGEVETEWTAHDQWVSFLGHALGRVVYLAEELADYRQHGANAYGYVNSRGTGRQPLATFMGKLSAYRDYRILEVVSGRRAQVLEEVVARSADWPSVQANARAAVAYYRQLERLYASRALTYSARSFLRRMSSWARMIAEGDYSVRKAPSFKSVSILRDLIQGVVLAKLRTGTAPTADYSLRAMPPAA